MSEDVSNCLNEFVDGNYIFKGRKRLTTELDSSASLEEILEDFKNQSGIKSNITAAKSLWDYAGGDQPILYRADETDGASSNNKVVVNFALAISRILSAYTFPKGISYLSNVDKAEYREFITTLNRMMSVKSGNVAAQEMKWYQSVCGHAFLYVNYDEDKEFGVPFSVQTICPWDAFVVYSKYDVYKPVYGGIKYNSDKVCIFTEKKWYIVDAKENTKTEKEHILGTVPIIEVPNNTMRMGDFEAVISLLNGTNTVCSDSVNNVQDVVRAYMVLFGVDPNEAENKDYRAGKTIAFNGAPGVTQSAKFISPQLDGNTVQNLRTYMDAATKFVTGIPDRDVNNSASSTGVSEDFRTGQSDKDAVANEKTIFVEQAQKRLLKIVFNILKTESPGQVPDGMDASMVDIDITRANRDNILTKSQALLNFISSGMSSEDAVYFTNITNDVTGVAQRMKALNSTATEDELNIELRESLTDDSPSTTQIEE